MAYTVSKVEMWTAEIDDRVGALDAKLAPLADAGVDLEIVVARRQQPGKGVVFAGPIKGAKGQKAASAAGLTRSTDLAALRVEGANKPGDCRKVTRLLAEAGISLRGLTASVCGGRYVLALGFDNEADAAKAASLLKGQGKKE